MNRLSDDMDQAIQNLTSKTKMIGDSPHDQSIIRKLLTQNQTAISKNQDNLNKRENSNYDQFAAMEVAVSNTINRVHGSRKCLVVKEGNNHV